MDEQFNLFDFEGKKKSAVIFPRDFFQLHRFLENKEYTIYYGFGKCQFGSLIEAFTDLGLCYLAFYEEKEQAVTDLKKRFPKAEFRLNESDQALKSILYFTKDWNQLPPLKLHLKGTDFQLKVWEALLNIPMGKTTTYKKLAENIGNKNAIRAVGTAAGKNPIAFLIPCHRLLQISGKIGGYRWGKNRKLDLLKWESE